MPAKEPRGWSAWKRPGFLTLGLAVLGLTAAGYSAWEQDWTTDEPNHLAWSRRLLETGETERESALHFNSKTPVTMANVVARQAARWSFGVRDQKTLRFITRLPTVALLAMLLLVTFLLTRSVAGETAAHLATMASALDPNLIANSSVATVDTAYALATLLTLGSALRFAEKPSLGRGAILGLALGFAFATKFTAFLLIPGLLLLPFARARRAGSPARGWREILAGVLGAIVVACVIVCGAYFFKKVGVALGSASWRSAIMVKMARILPGLRLPVPADFLTGLDICLASERNKAWNVVILGARHPDGVWYYFLVLWLVKTPLLILLATIYGLVRGARTGVFLKNAPAGYLALNVLLYVLYFSLIFRTQVGYRFVLMCIPIVYILSAIGLAPLVASVGSRKTRLALTAVLILTLFENSMYLGNHLAFTHAAIWPKREVFRLLADSNIDYGQNDEKLAIWLREKALTTHLDPVHILPGHNTINFNLLSGAVLFPRHRWLRENARPIDHFRHTYLFFQIDEIRFGRFLDAERRLAPSALGRAVCAPDEGSTPLASGDFITLLDTDRSRIILVCVAARGVVDLALKAETGRVTLGPGGQPRRDWVRIQAGQESWYRLESGLHVLGAAEAQGFQGRWLLRGGEAFFQLRDGEAHREGILRPEAPSETSGVWNPPRSPGPSVGQGSENAAASSRAARASSWPRRSNSVHTGT